jgi:iron(III) transport system permease protein
MNEITDSRRLSPPLRSEIAANPLSAIWRVLHVRPGSLACTTVLLVMLLLVLYPILLMIYSSFMVPQPDGTTQFGFSAWIESWSQAGMLQSVINTFKRVIVTEIIAFPLALLIAWAVTRTNIPGKKYIDAFFWIAFFLPALPVLMGWILLFDPDYGLVNQALVNLFDLPVGPFNIYSFSGIIFAHLAARSIAAKYIFMAPAFRNLDSSMEEAAWVTGSSTLDTIRRIVVPILTPAILITLCISLIHSLESFELELILGAPFRFYVFSTKIYQVINEDPPLFGVATVLNLTILISMLPLILTQQYLATHKRYTTVTSRFSNNLVRLKKARWPIFIAIFSFGFFITVVPVVFLFLGTFMKLFGHFGLNEAWTFAHWAAVLTDKALTGAIHNTLVMGLSAAFLGLIWYSIVAYISVRTQYRGRAVMDFLSWLPVTLPGVILGFAYLQMFLSVPLFQPLYGTLAVLVIAVMVNGISTGVQLIKSNMVQLGFDLEEASHVSGGSWLYTFRRVVLPLLSPMLISVLLITFASATRQVSSIAMLVIGDTRPLAMLQVDNMVDGNFESATVVGALIVIITLVVSFAARYIGGRFGFSGYK